MYDRLVWYGMDRRKVIFQHDNDPKHKVKSVVKWLNDQPFHVLECPAQSPDVNPMEYLWSCLKRRLNQYKMLPKGMLELWERVEDKWNQITAEDRIKLIENMAHRVESVLKAKGMWTKY
jgi:DDE superfamily endonuclease